MFSYIKGNLEIKATNYIVIDVGGVGFKVFMSESGIEQLGDINNIVKIYTHMQVREDDISLYGFITIEELRMFELLLSVSGIGAKSAVSMLSNITPSGFALAVITNDISKLTKIPGIGQKTAQRIVLELKDKLKTEETVNKNTGEIKDAIVDDNKISESVSALKVLGYNKNEIDKVMEKIDTKTLSVEDIIKKALSYLGM